MTDLDLKAIRARWDSHRDAHAASFPPAWRCCSGCRIAYDETPRLLAEVDRLTEENKAFDEMIDNTTALLNTTLRARDEARSEVKRLTALAAEYEGDNRHVIEFRDDGWTIMHPIACRPDLFGCVVNRVTSDQISGPPAQGLGRYFCHLDDQGELALGERVEAAPTLEVQL